MSNVRICPCSVYGPTVGWNSQIPNKAAETEGQITEHKHSRIHQSNEAFTQTYIIYIKPYKASIFYFLQKDGWLSQAGVILGMG